MVLGDYATGYIVTPTPPPSTALHGRPASRNPVPAPVDPDDAERKLAMQLRVAVPHLTIGESEVIASVAVELLTP